MWLEEWGEKTCVRGLTFVSGGLVSFSTKNLCWEYMRNKHYWDREKLNIGMDFKDNRDATNHVYGENGGLVWRLPSDCPQALCMTQIWKRNSALLTIQPRPSLFFIYNMKYNGIILGRHFSFYQKHSETSLERSVGWITRLNMFHLTQVLFDFFSRHNNDSWWRHRYRHE